MVESASGGQCMWLNLLGSDGVQVRSVYVVKSA